MRSDRLSTHEALHQRGAILGISNAVYSLAGLVAPWLAGHIVDIGLDPTAGLREGFLFAGCLICAGDILAAVLIHPARDLARFRQFGSPEADRMEDAAGGRGEISNPQVSRGAL